jgi:formylglycine-generating enzyme required for sulfatase activity
MLRRFTEARNNADYPQALLWLSELRASGQAIPAHFALDQKEADLQQRLREQEDRRRRREVADFQFEFVRAMLEIGDPDDIIQKAVEDIWQVEDGYIPDDLQKPLKKLLPRSDNTPDWTQAFALLRQRLPSPFDMIIIPAGSVTLGADDNGAKGGYITAPTTFDLAEFAIAKYPVTNAQFKLFIDAGGYREQRWWTEAGWAQRNADKWTQPRFWTDKKWNGAEYPVVGVSWYEAAAFCAWLAETTGLPVRLPGDAEWQRAAQGDDGRAYPWGNDWDGARCNHSVGKDWQKNQTSPVTRYEGKGDSPFGVVDMSGNAWEWCLTAYETGSNALEGTDVRMLRGGSWDLEDPLDFRAAYRYWSEPRDRYDVRGFRFMFSSLSL